MIKATELRIGNWVHTQHRKMVKGLHEPIQLKVITPQEEHKWEPVPLTHEWLEKFEFTDKEDIRHNEYEQETRYTLYKDDDRFHVGFVNEKYGGIDKSFVRIRMNADPIYVNYKVVYVHQLQNLYFALTGNELEIRQ